MYPGLRRSVVVVLAFFVVSHAMGLEGGLQEAKGAALPPGVRAVWDLEKAYREATPTRERVCINGLWRWQPVEARSEKVPADNWGYFKVPGPWPRSMAGPLKCYPHPNWKDRDLAGISRAWYQREITIPEDWAGRRITLYTEYPNSYAAVYVDGKAGGEIRWPGGQTEITSVCRPGRKQVLSIFVSRTGSRFRGLIGDVFLESMPEGARIDDVKIDTSVREWQISLDTAVSGLSKNARYVLRGEVTDGGHTVKTLESKPFRAGDVKNGRITFANSWKPDKLWDTHTPGNMYELKLSLVSSSGELLDEFRKIRFGFREFWVDGRYLRLNGSRITFFGMPTDNARSGPVSASYKMARENYRRLKAVGINLVYTHNYGCAIGEHTAFAEILRAADDTGMLLSFSQPQFGRFNWESPDADETNGYARIAEFYVRMAQNHPAVVMYSMSHNATSFAQALNPGHIDGTYTPWPDPKGKRQRVDRRGTLALRAQAIIQRLDQSRPIYHHSSANLGQFYTLNCYLNFVPIQERSDYFGHWGTEGVKPLLLVEYGEPYIPSWSDKRVWSTRRRVQWLLAEWASQVTGDVAYESSTVNERNRKLSANLCGLQGIFISENWPAFRTWGVTMTNKWQIYDGWNPRPGARNPPCTVDWDDIQKPGYSLDEIITRRWAVAYQESDWIPNSAGKALLRANTPLFAYIAGKPGGFTSKDHNFNPGDTVRKQVIVINNSRETVTADCSWSLTPGPDVLVGNETVTIETGEQVRIPVRLALPRDLKPGSYELKMTAKFDTGETQEDSFAIDVLPQVPKPEVSAKVALFDPKGETRKLLSKLSVKYRPVKADDDLAGYDVLIIGKHALSMHGPKLNLSRVREGLKVVMFEQSAEVLEKRMGFRVQEYALRRVFPRVSNHPLLAGLSTANLHDWCGEGTTIAPRLQTDMSSPNDYPRIQWCGITVTRAWRCGCRGSVASALIEKPTSGDFLPLVAGGFGLQYSPLMEYREGKGMILFCQMDVTGRTEVDPAATRLTENILGYVSSWESDSGKRVLYVGDPAGKAHLQSMRLPVADYEGGQPNVNEVLVVGPGGGRFLAAHSAAVKAWLAEGGHLLAVGLDANEANAFLPFEVTMKTDEYLTNYFKTPADARSLLRGIGAADMYTRVRRQLPLVTGGATALGNGVLAEAANAKVVFCQLAPWQFDYRPAGQTGSDFNIKPTFRRTSFVVTRLLGNMGVSPDTPLVKNIETPLAGVLREDVPGVVWLEGVTRPDTTGAALEPWRGDQTAATPERELILPRVWKGLPVGEAQPPQGWEDADFDDGKWRDIKVPGTWENQFADLINLNGLFLYRVKFKASAELAKADVTLVLGAIDDEDWTYLNGKLIGSVNQKTNPQDYYAAPRKYRIPKGILRAGENVLAVKVNDLRQTGGMKASLLKRRGVGSQRWLSGLYLDKPEKLDDPYRYYCW